MRLSELFVLCAVGLAVAGCKPEYDKVQKDIWDSQAEEIHKVLWEASALPNEATPFMIRRPVVSYTMGRNMTSWMHVRR